MNFNTQLFPIDTATETSVTCRHNGEAHHYEIPRGRTAEDIARWYAGVTGSGVTHYAVKIADREYEMVDDLGTPPAELLDDDREDDLDAWYVAREAALLAGTANA